MTSNLAVIVVFLILVAIILFFSSDAFNKITPGNQEPTDIVINELVAPIYIENKETGQIEIVPESIDIPPQTSPKTESPLSKEKQTELEIHRLINQERQKHDLQSLEYDEKLSLVAKSHSNDMNTRNYFAHDTPEGLDPTSRANTFGYVCKFQSGNIIYSGVAENIYKIHQSSITFWSSPESVAHDVVNGWMNSAGHRENILTEHYRSEGMGVVIAPFDVYVTQDFC